MITITIRTENAAFDGFSYHAEIARALRDLADRIATTHKSGSKVLDGNGNEAGRIVTTGKDARLL
jgi:hypothetical protein